MNLFIKKRGVTLLELIITIGILAIVISALYSFNLFGIKTYAGGESQWNLQSDARGMSELITHEVRYASKVDLSDQTPTSGDGYSYIRTEGNYVKYYKDGKLISSFPSNGSAGLTYSVDFTGSEGNLLAYKITVCDNSKGKSYSIDSKVLCLNIVDGESINIESEVIGSIKFK